MVSGSRNSGPKVAVTALPSIVPTARSVLITVCSRDTGVRC
ncbi:Uncharacterised protein [Mycobacteroides abscessus subsp. abscessus]|nr:Uncharacterised protein [Mycobacteroides abscessus subsp. abscessus]